MTPQELSKELRTGAGDFLEERRSHRAFSHRHWLHGADRPLSDGHDSPITRSPLPLMDADKVDAPPKHIHICRWAMPSSVLAVTRRRWAWPRWGRKIARRSNPGSRSRWRRKRPSMRRRRRSSVTINGISTELSASGVWWRPPPLSRPCHSLSARLRPPRERWVTVGVNYGRNPPSSVELSAALGYGVSVKFSGNNSWRASLLTP